MSGPEDRDSRILYETRRLSGTPVLTETGSDHRGSRTSLVCK